MQQHELVFNHYFLFQFLLAVTLPTSSKSLNLKAETEGMKFLTLQKKSTFKMIWETWTYTSPWDSTRCIPGSQDNWQMQSLSRFPSYLKSHGRQANSPVTREKSITTIFKRGNEEDPGNYWPLPLCQVRSWNSSSWNLRQSIQNTGNRWLEKANMASPKAMSD